MSKPPLRSYIASRQTAIVALLRVTGLRRAEVAGLDVAAYDRQAERLTVTGKLNKTRAIPIEDPGARGALADWLHLRGLKPGALFARIDRMASGGRAIARAPESGQPPGLLTRRSVTFSMSGEGGAVYAA